MKITHRAARLVLLAVSIQLASLGLGAGLGAGHALAQQAPQGDEALSVRGLNKRETVVFLSGMGTGIATANFFAKMRGGGTFCQPRKLRIDGRLVWELASESLKGAQKAKVIAIAAVHALGRKYPCK